MGGDPGSNTSIEFVAREIRWGWRDADGSAKPQSLFLADPLLAQKRDS
jgi:hypothetical protein